MVRAGPTLEVEVVLGAAGKSCSRCWRRWRYWIIYTSSSTLMEHQVQLQEDILLVEEVEVLWCTSFGGIGGSGGGGDGGNGPI
jgi:hypothetical protein